MANSRALAEHSEPQRRIEDCRDINKDVEEDELYSKWHFPQNVLTNITTDNSHLKYPQLQNGQQSQNLEQSHVFSLSALWRDLLALITRLHGSGTVHSVSSVVVAWPVCDSYFLGSLAELSGAYQAQPWLFRPLERPDNAEGQRQEEAERPR